MSQSYELLPDWLRQDLRIPGTAMRGKRTVRFRLDPGHLFERHGYITDNQDGTCNLGILQRYRPGDDLEWVVGTDRTEVGEIPSRLAELAGHASEKAAGLPHWRVAVTVNEPHLAGDWPNDALDPFGVAATTAAAMARYKRAFWYLYRDDAGLIDANNPPPLPTDCWSVSPRGEWSLHTDLATWPLDRDPAALQTATSTGADVIAEWAECVKPASLDWTFRLASPTHDPAGAAVTQSARRETSPRRGPGR